MDIGLESSVVEHLTRDARVLGSVVFLCNFSFLPSLLHLVPWPSLFRHLYVISPDRVNLCLSCDFEGVDFVRGKECGSSS